jgi:hypothetical protein
MLLDRTNLAVHVAASDDETRPSLGCVKVYANGATCATNGHILLFSSPSPLSEGDFPQRNGSKPLKGECLIPSEDCAQALKAIPKRHTIALLSQGCQLGEGPELRSTDLDRDSVISFRSPDQTFPTIQQVIPTGDNRITFTLSAAYLGMLAKLANKAPSNAITFTLNPEKPAEGALKGYLHHGNRLLGFVLMPMRDNQLSEDSMSKAFEGV